MKTILLGLDNPHSSDPAMALYTRPINASGYRLWQMIKDAANRKCHNFSERDYLEGYTRRNLLSSENYVGDRFNYSLMVSALKGRRVVMLGQKVPKLLGIMGVTFDLVPRVGDGFTYYVIPHPSGLCREYNDPIMRQRVGDLVYKLHDRHIAGD